MSKRNLKKYLEELSKAELEEQILDLYDRLKEVKTFYDFVFNPKEDKLTEDARFKIGKEYFPPGKRRAKKRRSVAQNIIKEYIKLGVDPYRVADIMIYHIEIAQIYNRDYPIKAESFYKAMLKGFKQAVQYIDENGLESRFKERIEAIADEVDAQNWFNKFAFEQVLVNRY